MLCVVVYKGVKRMTSPVAAESTERAAVTIALALTGTEKKTKVKTKTKTKTERLLGTGIEIGTEIGTERGATGGRKKVERRARRNLLVEGEGEELGSKVGLWWPLVAQ
jgi:hypothetical protein